MRRARAAARPLALSFVVVLVLVGCTDTPAVDGDPGQVETTAPPSPPASDAGDLRLEMERGFALRAHLATAVTRVQRRRLRAASRALASNAETLGETLADVYDDQTADELQDELDSTARRLADYREVVSRDAAGSVRRRARQRLRRQAAATSGFMSRVTDGSMERRGTSALLRAALLDLTHHVDLYASGDFEDAYATERDAYAAMTAVGRAFAAGVTEHRPDQLPGPRRAGALELRSAMGQLFGEHSGLAVTMTRRGSLGARDFDAAAAALNGNTEDLLAALETIYPDAVADFGAAWRGYISDLADYAAAVTQNRRGRRAEARTALDEHPDVVAAALADASEDTISRTELAAALDDHVAALVAQVEAYVDGQFDTAERHRLAAFEAAAQIADLIAAGIAEHRPDDFPPS